MLTKKTNSNDSSSNLKIHFNLVNIYLWKNYHKTFERAKNDFGCNPEKLFALPFGDASNEVPRSTAIG